MILYPLTHGLDLDQLDHDGLNPAPAGRNTAARTILSANWNITERTKLFGRAVLSSPHPFANPAIERDVASVFAWEQTKTGWRRLGRMPRAWIDGTMRPAILGLVRFDDRSALVYKRHPRKDNAGGNASFLLTGSVPLLTTDWFNGEVDDATLDTLLKLFEKHPDHSLLDLEKPDLPETAIARPFGNYALCYNQNKNLKEHDEQVNTLLEHYYTYLCAQMSQHGYFGLSLSLIGRRFTNEGTRTPFKLKAQAMKHTMETLETEQLPYGEQVAKTLSALSDTLHPCGGIVSNQTFDNAWMSYTDETENLTPASAHTLLSLQKTLMDHLPDDTLLPSS